MQNLKVSSGDTQASWYSLNARRLDQLTQTAGMQYHLGGGLVCFRLKTGGEASKSALQKEPSHQCDKTAQTIWFCILCIEKKFAKTCHRRFDLNVLAENASCP